MMTAEQLKASIMMLAIEGKLVKHNPADGTGEEQLRKIQEICRKKIQNGELKKGKPIPIITEDEYPFEIPTSWKFVRMDDLITVISGVSYKKGDVCKTGLRILRGGNIQNMKVIPDEDDVFLPQDYSDDLKQVKIGDVLIVASTGSKTVIGKPGYVNTELPNTMIGAFLRICRPVDIQCAEYLKIIFESEYYRKHIRDLAQGTNINNVKEEYITGMIVPLPPLEEQKRIVAKIEEMMPFVEQYAKASARLNTLNAAFPDQMKKSILQQAVMGKLVPQDPNDEPVSVLLKRIQEVLPKQRPSKDDLNYDSMNFDIPETWEWAELNELFDFVDYRGKTPHKIDQGVFLITASNIRQGFMEYTRKEYISEEEYLDRQSRGITHKGDLLFTTEAPMGNAAICDLNRCSCGQRIITFQPFCDQTVVPELYMYFILSPAFQLELLANCTGTTAKGIKADKLKHFRIPLPPYAEQMRIVQKLQEVIPIMSIVNTMQ